MTPPPGETRGDLLRKSNGDSNLHHLHGTFMKVFMTTFYFQNLAQSVANKISPPKLKFPIIVRVQKYSYMHEDEILSIYQH